jgi:hypothetical protein
MKNGAGSRIPKIEQSAGRVWCKLKRSYETNAPGLVPFIILLYPRPVRDRGSPPSSCLREDVMTYVLCVCGGAIGFSGTPGPGRGDKILVQIV